VESFHGLLREEWLRVKWFTNFFDARRKIAIWKTEYSEQPYTAASATECRLSLHAWSQPGAMEKT
jgi:Integrase core domain